MGTIPANTRPLDGPAPRLKAPPGAIDCHTHFYLDGFAPQAGGPPIAELATPADYAVVQKRLGLERVIVSQANAYQFDNGATLAALDQFGMEKARAVIVVAPDAPIVELKKLDARGVRGARIMDLPGGAVRVSHLKPVERLVREVGWSLMVQFNGRDIERYYDTLDAIETKYVIDHFGRFMPPVPADDDIAVEDQIERLFNRNAAEMNDAVDAVEQRVDRRSVRKLASLERLMRFDVVDGDDVRQHHRPRDLRQHRP